MTDPRTLLMQPVDEPLYGSAARAVAEALRPPADQPLWGATARRAAEALAVRPRPRSVA
ncbi:hypothetical protein ABTY20_22885 [Streptomyces sp. NPDC126497]|uniref:hypothetical protein n=1 Tax=Streptomyces sp. NPDC126497 TaxID=3155313 RepID=UPI00332A5DD0